MLTLTIQQALGVSSTDLCLLNKSYRLNTIIQEKLPYAVTVILARKRGESENLPMLHNFPVKPPAHVHENEEPSSLHAAPFKQGSASQGDTVTIKSKRISWTHIP